MRSDRTFDEILADIELKKRQWSESFHDRLQQIINNEEEIADAFLKRQTMSKAVNKDKRILIQEINGRLIGEIKDEFYDVGSNSRRTSIETAIVTYAITTDIWAYFAGIMHSGKLTEEQQIRLKEIQNQFIEILKENGKKIIHNIYKEYQSTFKIACDKLQKAAHVTKDSPDSAIKIAARNFLKDVHEIKKNKLIRIEDLPILTRYIDGMINVINNFNSVNLNNHLKNYKEASSLGNAWSVRIANDMGDIKSDSSLVLNYFHLNNENDLSEIIRRISNTELIKGKTPIEIEIEKLKNYDKDKVKNMLLKIENLYQENHRKMLTSAERYAAYLAYEYHIATGRDVQEVFELMIQGKDLHPAHLNMKAKALIPQMNAISREIKELKQHKKENESDISYYRNRIVAAHASLSTVRGKLNPQSDLELITKDKSSATRFFKKTMRLIKAALKIGPVFAISNILNYSKDPNRRGHYKFWKPRGYDHKQTVKEIEKNLRITRKH